MKKFLTLFILSSMLLGLSACSASGAPSSQIEERNATISEPAPSSDEATPSESKAALPLVLEGLKKDEYEGLKITASILPRKAILPGAAIPVTVLVENTSDKIVAFIQGSGSYTIPDAISTASEKLQYVLPEDHLGIVTEDFRVVELKPGESAKFDLFFMAIEPNAEFDKYTREQYENGAYIAKVPFEDLVKTYPSLTAVEPGSYDLSVFISYSIVEEGVSPFMASTPTGYAQADLTVSVM